MLENVTPVILTFNERENIGRTLERLSWARDVVIVDSLSRDDTVDIASQFKNVRLFRRPSRNTLISGISLSVRQESRRNGSWLWMRIML